MAEFKNYFFRVGNKDSFSLIDPNNCKDKYSLSGFCFGRPGFPDNSFINTSYIEKIEGKSVTTKSGSNYQLKDMHEDYKDFLNSIEKGIEILTNWEMTGNLREGYVISGTVNGQMISGKVVSQERNLITLKNNKTYFIMWSDFSSDVGIYIGLLGKYLDINYPDGFEKFCGFTCRPILFPK